MDEVTEVVVEIVRELELEVKSKSESCSAMSNF